MSLTVLAPLRLEALQLRRGLRGLDAHVVRVGMGPGKARGAAARHAPEHAGGAIAIGGVCGGVGAGLRAGDVVVASSLVDEHGGERDLPGAELLAGSVRALGLRCTVGPVLSVEALHRDARSAAGGRDVAAVDMESYWLADAAPDGPLAVLRVVADSGGRPVRHPRTLVDGPRALRALRRAAPALAAWGAATGTSTAVEGADEAAERPLDFAWRAGTRTIGLTAGASTSERLAQEVVGVLAGLGPVMVEDARSHRNRSGSICRRR